MTSKFEILIRVICVSIAILMLLYNIGVLIQEARKETRNKIIEAINYCHDYHYILGPTRDQLLECIKNAKIK